MLMHLIQCEQNAFLQVKFKADALKQKYYDLNENRWVFDKIPTLVDFVLTYTDKREVSVNSPTDGSINVKSLPVWSELVQPWLDNTLTRDQYVSWLESNQDKFECL